MDRQSSDKIASLASAVMRNGNPLKDDALVDQIIANVRDTLVSGTQADARNAIREPLMQYFETAQSLAASVVSQADGPEG